MNFNILYAIPSANLKGARESLPVWRCAGYRVAVLVESHVMPGYEAIADLVISKNQYRGYPWAVREMMLEGIFEGADIVVTGGDDVFPDSRNPQEIAGEFFKRFPDGFGVMQPTGDGHGWEKICGSPWMGRAFVFRINGGQGPFWPEYKHFFCDREMKMISEQLNILWQRPDLVHRHEHWSWTGQRRPSHMLKHHHCRLLDERLFLRRRQLGFPGHLPIQK